MAFKLIVTLGPAILNSKTIEQIRDIGPCLYRINGSHSSIEEIRKTIDFVKNISSDLKLMVDLPGNKIRTSKNYEKRVFKEGDTFSFGGEDLNFSEFFKFLSVGDVLFTNDSLNSLVVCGVDEKNGVFTIKAQDDGELIHNKGIHVRQRDIELPFLLEKDKEIIQLVNESEVDCLALSFVRHAEDIKGVKALLRNGNTEIIAKVEKMEAIENLESILEEVDNILIDRGDLSNDIGMLDLPFYQDQIVQKAKAKGKSVYLATQFLKYMEHNSIPLIAEVMGLYNDLSEGVAGLQLSEETAIGKYPLECIKLVFGMHKLVQSHSWPNQEPLVTND